MKLVISASGGGHTGYAVALAQHLQKFSEILFIVPKNDIWSKAKVEKYGRVAYSIKPRGPRDPLLKSFPKLIYEFYEGLKIIPRDFDVFISTGSNHSVPLAYAAKLKGLKIINIESSVRFTKPSLSVRVIKPIADITVLQWPEQKKIIPEGIVVGPLFELPKYKSEDRGYILVTGGTYGHKLLFDALAQTSIRNIVLQTGKINPEKYKKIHPEWTVFDFDPNFQKWIAGASVVVSHLGKTAVDAALTYGKPVVIVPNPEWTYTAGLKDAEILARKLNALIVHDISSENIENAIEKALSRKPPKYANGAKKLVELIIDLTSQ
ncbi:MAG: polysaccharide biosynthesis protein [Desulfurococcales archaeon ex4484_217_2]|nr:MAG: polysaccharide biosynthesis protein [Desulfurococcales archaeon ex4484_217_2]